MNVHVLAFFMISSFVLAFLLYGNFAESESVSGVTAFRAAEMVKESILKEIEMDRNRKISNLSGTCINGVLSGKNSFGSYSAEFQNSSSVGLDCSDAVSKIAYIQIVGYFGGSKVVLGWRIEPENASVATGSNESSQTLQCGENAKTYRGSDLTWAYDAGSGQGGSKGFCVGGCPGSAPPSGCSNESLSYLWNLFPSEGKSQSWECYKNATTSVSCTAARMKSNIWDGGSSEDNGSYVTTGPESQVKSGSFGVTGAFKAYSGIDVDGEKISNLAVPSNNSDIANKQYVDEEIKKAFGK